ncbi:MAG: hypothetical protein ACI9LM_005542 [Alteromonadaceae bacterium]|jgi:hypothetical protein
MLSNNYLAESKHIFLMFLMSFLLVACNKSSDESEFTEVIVEVPTLNDQNIKDFTIKMAKDYNELLDSLLLEFNVAKKAGDEYRFVNFRNHTWTPNYIEQKNYYQNVLAHNSSYLAKLPTRILFDKFEYLIYIGIELKNVLLDEDDVKLQEQLAAITKNKVTVDGLIK